MIDKEIGGRTKRFLCWHASFGVDVAASFNRQPCHCINSDDTDSIEHTTEIQDEQQQQVVDGSMFSDQAPCSLFSLLLDSVCRIIPFHILEPTSVGMNEIDLQWDPIFLPNLGVVVILFLLGTEVRSYSKTQLLAIFSSLDGISDDPQSVDFSLHSVSRSSQFNGVCQERSFPFSAIWRAR